MLEGRKGPEWHWWPWAPGKKDLEASVEEQERPMLVFAGAGGLVPWTLEVASLCVLGEVLALSGPQSDRDDGSATPQGCEGLHEPIPIGLSDWVKAWVRTVFRGPGKGHQVGNRTCGDRCSLLHVLFSERLLCSQQGSRCWVPSRCTHCPRACSS